MRFALLKTPRGIRLAPFAVMALSVVAIHLAIAQYFVIMGSGMLNPWIGPSEVRTVLGATGNGFLVGHDRRRSE
jgi:hypothetical protein